MKKRFLWLTATTMVIFMLLALAGCQGTKSKQESGSLSGSDTLSAATSGDVATNDVKLPSSLNRFAYFNGDYACDTDTFLSQMIAAQRQQKRMDHDTYYSKEDGQIVRVTADGKKTVAMKETVDECLSAYEGDQLFYTQKEKLFSYDTAKKTSKLLYTAKQPIQHLTGGDLCLFFLTGNTIYRYFVPDQKAEEYLVLNSKYVIHSLDARDNNNLYLDIATDAYLKFIKDGGKPGEYTGGPVAYSYLYDRQFRTLYRMYADKDIDLITSDLEKDPKENCADGEAALFLQEYLNTSN